VIATTLVLALAGVAAGPAVGHAESHRRRERNVRLAARRAEHQLGAVSLPPGSLSTRLLPTAADRLLSPEPVEVGTVVRRRFWIVPRDPSRVFAWLENHRPGRFHRLRGGSFETGFFDEEPAAEPVREAPTLVSGRRGGRGVLGSRLVLTAVRLASQSSAVRIEDLVTPVRPRPVEERIPGAVTKIRLKIEHHPGWDATIAEEGEFPLVPPSNEGEVRSVTIHDRRRVAAIVDLVERRRVVQPPLGLGDVREILVPEEEEEGSLAPAAPLKSTVHLLFESAAGSVLAEASQREDDRQERMRFAVGGEAMAPLQGGVKVLRALIPERRRAVRTRLPLAQRPAFPRR
jgi:hypothetical protein